MRDIPADLIAELIAQEYRPFWLAEFTVNGTDFFVTDCDVPIAIGSDLYEPRGFKIPNFRYSDKQMVDAVSLVVDNLDALFTSDFVAGSPQGVDFYLRQVFLDSSYRPISQVTGPIGHWKLSEAVGDIVADFSANLNNGTLEGSPLPAWTAWGDTWALDFEKANSNWIDLLKPSELAFTARPLAISAWINAETLTAWDTIFSKVGSAWTAGGYGIHLGAAANTLLFWVEHYTVNVATIAFTTTGTWVHILAVWESDGTMEIYVDNVASGSPDSYTGVLTNVDYKAAIGAYNDGALGHFDGLIGNVQIFDRDLTAAEKTTLAAGGVVGAGTLTLFEGALDAWDVDEQRLKLTAKSEMSRWTQRPLSLHSVSCRWKDFKGTECAYAGGETSCDRTYTRCVQLGNTANFGGFRWLPSIMDREIWWGKIPK